MFIMVLMSFIEWIKDHKNWFFVLAFVVIIYLFFQNSRQFSFQTPGISENSRGAIDSSAPYSSVAPSLNIPKIGGGADTNQRIVIKNSNLSLLVKDVQKTGDEVLDYTKSLGGFMVSTSYNRPQETPFGEITVRIPTEKLDESLKKFRSLGLKVTSENLIGNDVTDQYKDIDANLATLEKTKAKFEAFLDRSTTVADSLNVQREITNLQVQIDMLKGQKKAIEENASFTKITLFLSTDELALPYTPDKTFRPQVIFKQAVRSLFSTLQNFGEVLIWIGVYSVIWIPLLLGYFGYRRWKARKLLN